MHWPLILVFFLLSLAGVADCQCPNGPGVGPRNLLVREVDFVTTGSSTFAEQNQVAASIIGLCYAENNKGDIQERIRLAFQRLGFFEIGSVALKTQATDSADPSTISLIAHVDEGQQYRLKGITFTGNGAISNASALRSQFPITDGDIFDKERVTKGLEDLREAYAQLGYINFTGVPETHIEEETKLISLNIDCDEGKQFAIGSFTIKGVDQQTEAALRSLWPEMLQPGRIYNARLIKYFFQQAQSLLPGASPDKNLAIKQNSRDDTVDILFSAESNVN